MEVGSDPKVLRDSVVLEHSARMGVTDKPRREQNSHEDPENPSFLIHQEGSKNRDSPTQTLKNTGFLAPMLGRFCC